MPICQKSWDAGIPVFGCNSVLVEGMWFSTVCGYGQLGATTMRYLLDSKGGNANVAFIHEWSTPGQLAYRGAQSQLPNYPNGTVVADHIINGSDPQHAQMIAEDLIQANPDLDAIWCSSDELATYAATAVAVSGATDQIFVTGIGGTQTTRDLVDKGWLAATAYRNYTGMARYTATKGEYILDGGSIGEPRTYGIIGKLYTAA